MDFSGYSSMIPPYNTNLYQQSNDMINRNINICKFMHDFNDEVRDKFNPFWFERNDDSLINGMKYIILSSQRDKYFVLKVLNFEVIKDYKDIMSELYNWYNIKAKKGKRNENDYEYINLRDSDIMLLKVRYYVKLNIPENKIHIDAKTKEPEKTEGEVDVLIMLPRYVNKYYFRLAGKFYNPIFQIVDGSTYNNITSKKKKAQCVTLKTNFMPIRVFREIYTLHDIYDKSSKLCTMFTANIFSKKSDLIKFILGRYGLYGSLEFLGLLGIYFSPYSSENIYNPSAFYNFKDTNNNIIISVIKEVFDRDLVTQSFIYTILKNVKKLQNFQDLFDPRYWVKNLGADFQSATLEKGISVLDSLEAIYDIQVRDSIKLPLEDKSDSYRILRWLMREFTILCKKDNMDISTKHPRLADEYIPASYGAILSKNIYRISDKGKNITFKDVLRAIVTKPDCIIRKVYELSSLVSYVDLVNDNDAEMALSYTYKGISGLGDTKNTNAKASVSVAYRLAHPSQLGRVDIDSSSNSDPGMSGIICPTSPIYGKSFSDYSEPNTWRESFGDILNDLKEMYQTLNYIEYSKCFGTEYDYIKEEIVRDAIESYQKVLPSLVDTNPNNSAIIIDGDDDEVGQIEYSEEELDDNDLEEGEL